MILYLARETKKLIQTQKKMMVLGSLWSRELDTIILQDRKAGLFSLIFQVLATAMICERKKLNLVIDFVNSSYSQNAHQGNTNWWSCIFKSCEIINNPNRGEKRLLASNIQQMHKLADIGGGLPRYFGWRTLRRFELQDHISSFISTTVIKDFKGKNVLGVHYRGTDKVSGDYRETSRVPYENMMNVIDKYIYGRDKLFIATDEEGFLESAISKYGDMVLFQEATRSKTNESVHMSNMNDNGQKIAREAVIDSVLLSKTNMLLRTKSNLSIGSLYFNPYLKYMTI